MTVADSRILADALALMDAAKYTEALALAETALAAGEATSVAACVVAAVAYRHGHLANALHVLEPIANGPDCSASVAEAVAVLNCKVGRLHDALYWGKVAVTLTPEHDLLKLFGRGFPAFSDAFTTIVDRPLMRDAERAFKAGHLDDALQLCEQHLSLFTNDVGALDLYSDLLMKAGRPDEAIGVLRSVLTMGGHSATLLSRLGRCLSAIGEHDAGMACQELALTRAPKSAAVWSGFLSTLDGAVDGTSERREQGVRRWTEFLATRLPKTVRPAGKAAVKDKLTIGFLCASPLDEETQIMLGRIAAARAAGRVATIGFGAGELGDEANIHFRGAFDRWRDIAPLDELTLSVLIRGEGVDVLVDLDGAQTITHPSLFLRNAAPVQVSWLNGPCGLPMPGATHTLDGLASGPLLFHGTGLVPGAAPVASRGAITFGADLSMAELTPRLAMAWSSILQAVPGSTLVLRDRDGLSKPVNAERLINLFGNFGVSHRIDLIAAYPAEFFGMVDVALAPFPVVRPGAYGKALRLGVPVVTLAEGRSRFLAASLSALGIADGMVAADLQEYVAHATAWATDTAKLAAFRQSAPAALAGRPAYDAAAFAEGLEALLRGYVKERAAA
jgi:protein O-GlcNAc transferase